MGSIIVAFFVILIILVFISAILIDLASLYLNLRRTKRGYGPSGIPGISCFIYLGVLAYGCKDILVHEFEKGIRYILIFILLFVFHTLCHFIIPLAYVKYLRRKRK